MTFNNYTQKSLEAVQSAQNIAVQHSNQQLEQIHLLLAMLQQEGGLTPQLLRKIGVSTESLEAAAVAEVRKLPAVTGSREADRFYISTGVVSSIASVPPPWMNIASILKRIPHWNAVSNQYWWMNLP